MNTPFLQTKEETIKFLKKYEIKNYTINPDLTVDVDGDVSLNGKNLTKIPVKFKTVTGDFFCYRNNLTSLEGSPATVGGYFYCYNNKLTSLEGSPTTLGGYLYCSENPLSKDTLINFVFDKRIKVIFNDFKLKNLPKEGESKAEWLLRIF